MRLNNYCVLIICLCVFAQSSLAAETYGPYTATVIRVIDGDTIELNVHTWPGTTQNIRLRLDGVNTPEKRRASECEKVFGRQATQFTKRFIGNAEAVTVSGVRLGKYAKRALGKILVVGKGDLGAALLKAGLAKEYHGGKRTPWCQ